MSYVKLEIVIESKFTYQMRGRPKSKLGVVSKVRQPDYQWTGMACHPICSLIQYLMYFFTFSVFSGNYFSLVLNSTFTQLLL